MSVKKSITNNRMLTTCLLERLEVIDHKAVVSAMDIRLCRVGRGRL